MRYVIWLLITLLLNACTAMSPTSGAKTSIPPDSFLQEKVLEVGREMGFSLAYENRDEGLFFWSFKVKSQGSEQAGKECEVLFCWYIKRVGNSIALNDPVAFMPGCQLEPKQLRAEARHLQEDFKHRWIGLVGPVTLIGPTVSTHSWELSGQVMGRLIKEKIEEPAHTLFVGTEGSPVLKRDVTEMVMRMDAAKDKECTQRKIMKTELVEVGVAPRLGIERWTVDRCGKFVIYRITLTPDPKGGTQFMVELEQ